MTKIIIKKKRKQTKAKTQKPKKAAVKNAMRGIAGGFDGPIDWDNFLFFAAKLAMRGEALGQIAAVVRFVNGIGGVEVLDANRRENLLAFMDLMWDMVARPEWFIRNGYQRDTSWFMALHSHPVWPCFEYGIDRNAVCAEIAIGVDRVEKGQLLGNRVGRVIGRYIDILGISRCREEIWNMRNEK